MPRSLWPDTIACCISRKLLPQFEEADMSDLLTRFSQQHHGLGTFRIFQRKLEDLIKNEPEHRALYRLLSSVGAVQRAGGGLKPKFSHKTQIERITGRLGLAADSDVTKLWI